MLAIPYPAIDPIAIAVGPVAIKWYGLAYVAGLLLGWLYIKRLLTTNRLWQGNLSPLPPDVADDLFAWIAIGVVVGGRLGHVTLYEPDYYFSHPLEILKIWQGGMAFHGGLVGSIVAMWIFARMKGVSAFTVWDIAAAAVPFGLFFGRTANFINAEVIGRVSDAPWAMVFPGAGPLSRHPVQLYEALLEGLVLFLILRWLTHTRYALKTPGLTGAAFLAGYGAFRMVCEVFKEDYSGLFGTPWLTSGMVYSVPMVAVGAVAMWVLTRPEAEARSVR
ncbi:MAG: prolipoprotein diacylglyceryl transferase [Hyphomicrobiaceae bacterium]